MKRLLPIGLVVTLSGQAHALNEPRPSPSVHPQRLLATAALVFNDTWIPASAMLGGLYQVSVLGTSVSAEPCPEDMGPGLSCGERVEAPSLYLHFGGHAGYQGVGERGVFGLGEAGLVVRRGSETLSWLTSAGLVAGALVPQARAGPMLRLEIMDNIGVEGGVLLDGRGDVFWFAAIDYFAELLSDLGLTR